jgi:hypothetical protein
MWEAVRGAQGVYCPHSSEPLSFVTLGAELQWIIERNQWAGTHAKRQSVLRTRTLGRTSDG